MSKFQSWLYAFRLRTLPLAFSSIITGSSVAFAHNKAGFKWGVFALCITTTLLLQVLSNLANDYGDSEKGTDNDERIGPKRAVQAGLLSFDEIKIGMVLCSALCFVSGLTLIFETFHNLHAGYSLFFLLLGVGAIAAAIKYTVGDNAYGYVGLGDVFVLLFFGFVGVCGSYYLLALKINYALLLPGLTIGAFAAGVLNLNNMRDMASDAKAGKITLVVRLGLARAKIYHICLIVVGFLSSLVFVVVDFRSSVQLLFIITAIIFRKHLVEVRRITEPREFDPLLKQLAIFTFIFAILFAIGQIAGE